MGGVLDEVLEEAPVHVGVERGGLRRVAHPEQDPVALAVEVEGRGHVDGHGRLGVERERLGEEEVPPERLHRHLDRRERADGGRVRAGAVDHQRRGDARAPRRRPPTLHRGRARWPRRRRRRPPARRAGAPRRHSPRSPRWGRRARRWGRTCPPSTSSTLSWGTISATSSRVSSRTSLQPDAVLHRDVAARADPSARRCWPRRGSRPARRSAVAPTSSSKSSRSRRLNMPTRTLISVENCWRTPPALRAVEPDAELAALEQQWAHRRPGRGGRRGCTRPLRRR